MLDRSALRAAADEFRTAFPAGSIYYALKANSHPAVIATLVECGCGFEAASWGEIELLLSCGIPPSRIIYGTSVKPEAHVRRAAAAGIDRFAADCAEELSMIAEAAPGARVFLRMAADDSSAVFRLNRKFGALPAHVPSLMLLAAELRLVPWGISFNVGSQVGDPSAWARAIELLPSILEDLRERGIVIETLNIGGGFPVSYLGNPSASLGEIAAPVFAALGALPYAPELILEPGRRLVAQAVTLVTSVIARVERPHGPWLFLDCGAYNALFEALRCQGSTRYAVQLARLSRCDTRAFVLAGPTGDSLDMVAEAAMLPADVAVGDTLLVEGAGAYTTALASTFNGFPVPPVRMVV